MLDKNISYTVVPQSEIEKYLMDLAHLRISIFRDYPYLYDGSLEYEMKYLKSYSESPQSFICIVKDHNKIIGATTAIPLSQVSEFSKPFLDLNMNINNAFYFGESILQKDYRGLGIGKKFFSLREEFSKKVFPNLSFMTFCSVERPINHSKRPNDYKDLHSFWKSLGYQENQSIHTNYKWKDVDEEFETAKKMIFWVKNS